MQRLADEITRALKAQETVGIYFTWLNWGEYRAGYVLLARGQLAQLAVHNKSGRAALADLKNLELRDLIVTPLDDSPRPQDPDLPQITALLSQLQPTAQPFVAPTPPPSPAPAPPISVKKSAAGSTDALVRGAQALLIERLGPNSLRELQQVAAQFPPDTHPMQFLDECERLIEPRVGRQKAARLLDSLRMLV